MANYISKFCPHLYSVAAHLSELKAATKYWKWIHLHVVSFAKDKIFIMSNKVLKPSNSDPSYRIYLVCESSDTGIAGWIAQKQEDGLIRPPKLHSRTFSDSHMNNAVHKRELFPIVDIVRYFKGILQGHPVTIVTYDRPLLAFISSLQTNLIPFRSQESLRQLDTTIDYL